MALLHIENMQDDTLNFKLKGDRLEVAKMIRCVLDARPDVLVVFASAVLDYFKEHDIQPDTFLRKNGL